MNRKILLACLILIPSLLFAQQPVNIIPKPVSLQIDNGYFLITENTSVVFDKHSTDLQKAANFFTSYIKNISGYSLSLNTLNKKAIHLLIKKIAGIGDEGYLLNVLPASIEIIANTKAGIIYGMQSLFQTLPQIRTNAALEVPCMAIKDYPQFSWRGMHLDVSRHFFSPEMIKEYINLMAAYKLNVFHWHLVDDQGWRIEIKKYPLLTSTGAWRVDENDKDWSTRPQAEEGEAATYGGYYTQEQIKDIIKYASDRNVTIVPEIEMPGHVASAIAAYPYLSCTQQAQLPLTGGNYTNMSSNYCAGNDSVFLFLENVLTEVINLFPSEYIHIGGDEVDKTSWKNCVKCQARMKAEGLKNEDELQSYFIKRIEKFIVSKHRKMIGWDEILEGGLAPEATVMSWRGEAGGIQAAQMGHDVVMTPGTPLYFNQYQAMPDDEPVANGGFNTLKMVYDYNPVSKELTAVEAKHILGAQGNVWTEYISTVSHLEYMVLPRMLALAEALWTPAADKNWTDFYQRLQYDFNAFDEKGYNYSKGNFTPVIKPLSENKKLLITLTSEIPDAAIYFTLDGSSPTLQSDKYESPININTSLHLKAATAIGGKIMSKQAAVQNFVMHKAIGAEVTYTNPVSKYYMADGPNALTDGVRGTYDVGKYWHGFSEEDMIATVDMGEETSIKTISLGCLQRYKDWIFLPSSVTFETSTD
ncbi:MAG: family 20 glycosylhydrolase, partial [Parafilimonas sp.]